MEPSFEMSFDQERPSSLYLTMIKLSAFILCKVAGLIFYKLKKMTKSIFELVFENGIGFGVNDPSGQTRLVLNPITPNVPDVLTNELTFEYLKSIFHKSRTKLIKPILTDLRQIRCLGNAYVDEILWEIKVSPASVAAMLTDQKIHELIDAITKVLTNAEMEAMKRTGDAALMVEKRDFMKVHNSKWSADPNGDEIFRGEIAGAKTYWTKSQIVYEYNHQVFGKIL